MTNGSAYNLSMSLCDAPVIILAQIGGLAITPRSLPALAFVLLYLGVFGYLTIRNRRLKWLDPVLLLMLVAIQSWASTTGAVDGGIGLSGVALLGPGAAFLIGYGFWRVSGGEPLLHWPWYRFGLLVTLSILATDIVVGLLTPPPVGSIWQLGGACVSDALVLGPPFLVGIYRLFLVCGNRWTFCSHECVSAGRCRHGCGSTEKEPIKASTHR